MQTIYIDVLLCVDLIINYLLLSAAAFCTHSEVTIKRLMLGAGVGALCSLTILLPELPFIASAALKAAVGAATVSAAFAPRSRRELLRLYAVFLTATFFFGGAIFAAWYLFTPKNVMLRNGVVYLGISPVMLITLSAVCYGIFRLFHIVTGTYKVEDTVCMLTLKNGTQSIRVPAKIDTGNDLHEPFSQCPVVVIGRKTAEAIVPAELAEYETVTTLKYRTEISGVRFVPFTSVGGSGILPCFRASETFINDLPCQKRVYIALCSDERILGGFKALVPNELIP